MIINALNSFIMSAAILGCPGTKMVNPSKLKWNEEDYKVLSKAEKRCGEIYRRSPCVKVFIKRTEMDYSVVCGQKEKK